MNITWNNLLKNPPKNEREGEVYLIKGTSSLIKYAKVITFKELSEDKGISRSDYKNGDLILRYINNTGLWDPILSKWNFLDYITVPTDTLWRKLSPNEMMAHL